MIPAVTCYGLSMRNKIAKLSFPVSNALLLLFLFALLPPSTAAATACQEVFDSDFGPYVRLNSPLNPIVRGEQAETFSFDQVPREIMRLLVRNGQTIRMISRDEAQKTDWAKKITALVRFNSDMNLNVKSMDGVPEELRDRLAATYLQFAANYLVSRGIPFSIQWALRSSEEQEIAAPNKTLYYLKLEPDPKALNSDAAGMHRTVALWNKLRPDWTFIFDPFGQVHRGVGGEADTVGKRMIIPHRTVFARNLKNPGALHELRHLKREMQVAAGEIPLFSGITMDAMNNRLPTDYESPNALYTTWISHDEPRAFLQGLIQYLRDLRAPIATSDKADIGGTLRSARLENWYGLVTASTTSKVAVNALKALESAPASDLKKAAWPGLWVEFLLPPEKTRFLVMEMGAEGSELPPPEDMKRNIQIRLQALTQAADGAQAVSEVMGQVIQMLQKQQDVEPPSVRQMEVMRHSLLLTAVHYVRAIDRGQRVTRQEVMDSYNRRVRELLQ